MARPLTRGSILLAAAVAVPLLGAPGAASAAAAEAPLPWRLLGPPDTSSYANDVTDHGLIVGWAGTTAVRPAAWLRGRFVDLGAPPSAEGTAEAANERGEVVGAYRDPVTARSRAFRWRAGRLSALPDAGGDAWAVDVSDRGLVVGSAAAAPGAATGAAAWGGDGRLHLLPSLGGVSQTITARAVNRSGDIVGLGTSPVDGQFTATLWRHGRAVDLGCNAAGEGPASDAVDINDRGQVICQVFGGEVAHGVVVDRRGRATPIRIGGAWGFPYDINDRGQVVGYYSPRPGEARAFVWQDGVGRDLGGLGDGTGSAVRINERGQAVGNSGSGRAVLWQPDGRVVDLGDPANFRATTAEDVNDRGLVVGATLFPLQAVSWQAPNRPARTRRSVAPRA